LHTWDALVAYTQAEWYPSRIAFGKYKGRMVEDARTDAALRQWLEWLADSRNERSAKMGRWYLAQLDGVALADKGDAILVEVAVASSSAAAGGAAVHAAGLVVFVHPEIQEMERLIAAARARLAALEADYTEEHHAVEITRRQLFEMLRTQYQQRDRFKLVIAYRRKYLDILMFEGEDEAEEATSEYEEAQAQSDAEYAQAEAGFAEQVELSEEDKAELKSLYRKLVRLYHPDRFENDEKRRETYHLLTSAINQARDNADIEVLREIAHDTEGFLMRQGWGSLDFSEAAELASRRKLFDMLQLKIVTTLEAINTLKEDPAYTLHQMTLEQPGYLQTVAVDYAARLEAEIEQLETEAQALDVEIEALRGI
jgi:DNA polymerase-3 subunit epsilon